MRRYTRLAILLIMVLMVGLLWSGAKKPDALSDKVTSDMESRLKPAERPADDGATASAGTVEAWKAADDGATASAGTVEAWETADDGATASAGTDAGTDDGGSAHISPGLDSAITYTIIPLFVLVFALLYKKQYDKEGFQKALVQLWGVIKDIDNVFSAPGAEVKYSKIIGSDGINGAKKLLAKATAQQTLPVKSVNILTKVAGSLDSAIELAITTFKAGSVIIPAVKKLFK